MATVKGLSARRNGREVFSLLTKTNWMVCVLVVLLLASLMSFFEAPSVTPVSHPVKEAWSTDCQVRPIVLGLEEIDSPYPNGTIPLHVREFDKKNISLPKYPASELLLVSAVSNNTYDRKIAQEYTFGRIYTIRFVTWDEYPHCVLCQREDQDDRCHCPSFKRRCSQDIFFYREIGWWCHTRKGLYSILVALKEWKGDDLPKWLVFMDDNTFINPISMAMLISNLDPDQAYFVGDTMSFGGIAAGGAGALISRAVLRKLMGPPVFPIVTYRWPNGTHMTKVHSQLEYCLAQMQGGDWCYYHGDWSLSQCVEYVSVMPTDIGGGNHGGFFSQRYEVHTKKGASWFYLTDDEMSEVLHLTHAAAAHSPTVDDMYHTFYDVVVPFYQNLRFAYNQNAKNLS